MPHDGLRVSSGRRGGRLRLSLRTGGLARGAECAGRGGCPDGSRPGGRSGRSHGRGPACREDGCERREADYGRPGVAAEVFSEARQGRTPHAQTREGTKPCRVAHQEAGAFCDAL